MPPAGPKSDINRSGAEVSDFPAVCNDCLSATDNPFIQMIKEDRGMECKICTRPFTVFRWAADRTSRFKKTNVSFLLPFLVFAATDSVVRFALRVHA